jgi:lipopolysaccharide export system protein LptA
MNKTYRLLCCLFAFWAAPTLAQTGGMQLDRSAPIEVVSDALEVLQTEQKAIFSGNVIATQGTINMRAERMVVFYREAGVSEEGAAPAMGTGIYRIEAEGDVFFASPQETAKGTTAIYDVDNSTVDLLGDVLLTRGGNVLKGTRLNYNLATSRSVLTGGTQAVQADGTKTGRVRGLFVPKQAGAETLSPKTP